MLAGRKGTLEARHGGRLGAHAFGDRSLGQTCFLACLEQGIEKRCLITLDTFDLGAYARALH